MNDRVLLFVCAPISPHCPSSTAGWREQTSKPSKEVQSKGSIVQSFVHKIRGGGRGRLAGTIKKRPEIKAEGKKWGKEEI